MRKTILSISLILAASVGFTHAQDVFKKHGFKKNPLTFCDGQYNEFFNNPEVVQVGTVLFNTRTNKVVKLLDENAAKATYKAEFSSMCLDPHAEKYYSISPYAYCSGNPVNAIDIDGRDEFLLTWLPKGDAVGHSAIGIQERDSKGNPTGNIIVRHLWPEGGGAEPGKQYGADYRKEVISAADLGSFGGGEGRGADGIVKIVGDSHQDNVMSAGLNLDEKTNSKYEMPNNDCATYTKGAVESVGINGSTPSTVKVEGATSGITYKTVDAVTPGSVHNAVANSGDKRVEVIKPLPNGNGNPNIVIKAPDKEVINYLKNSN